MVKKRPGSKKGLTKLNRAVRRSHRRQMRVIPSIPNPDLRAVWDLKKTPAQNLAKSGLQPRINSLTRSRSSKNRTIEIPVIKIPQQNPEVLMKMERSASRPERKNLVVRPGEQVALKNMVSKHGMDYSAMAKDIKLNYLQWTPAQLRKRIERMNIILEQ